MTKSVGCLHMSHHRFVQKNNTTTYITRFWLPLAAMWLFMGVEIPIINAFIARIPFAKENLAAFGVVFSIVVLVESPIIQMLTTGTALTSDKRHFRRLMTFMSVIGFSLTAIHLVIALTPLFDFILGRLMGMPSDIVEISKMPFLVSFPFHIAVGFRRLWQGVLIKYGKTKQVTYTMVVRFSFTIGIIILGFLFTDFSGALLGSLALNGGIIAGAVASWIFLSGIIKEMEETRTSTSLISWRDLIHFYLPLALTSLITVGVRPVLAAGIARGRLPLESLAAWPVIHSFIFLFRSVALSYQEVVVALIHNKDLQKDLRKFAIYLTTGIGALFIITAVTDLSELWFTHVAGLEPELLRLTTIPFLLGAPVPALTALVSYYRGKLVYERRTKTIAWAVFINTALVITTLFIGVAVLPVTGAAIAAGALSISLVVETLFLSQKSKK